MKTKVQPVQNRITIYFSREDMLQLKNLEEKRKLPKSKVLKEALYLLLEKELDDDLRAGAIANAKQDLQIAEEGMNDWSKLLKDHPYDFKTKKR
ncbi:hypothetical protein HZA99_02425 [Candidatus Woesearchaeota archaeon]|nr:hypothetical protein [Candidatus Woesearchaeota archaeon]